MVSFLGSHNVAASGEQVELTFVPTGPLIDGSTGEPFTRLVTGRDGDLVKGIPVGPYRLTAEVIQAGGGRLPLELGRTWTGELAPVT